MTFLIVGSLKHIFLNPPLSGAAHLVKSNSSRNRSIYTNIYIKSTFWSYLELLRYFAYNLTYLICKFIDFTSNLYVFTGFDMILPYFLPWDAVFLASEISEMRGPG